MANEKTITLEDILAVQVVCRHCGNVMAYAHDNVVDVPSWCHAPNCTGPKEPLWPQARERIKKIEELIGSLRITGVPMQEGAFRIELKHR